MMRALVSFLAGVLFAIGLGIAGMTQPEKVRGFLDVTGNWDLSLMFVMVGAIAVNSVAYFAIARRRAAPILGGAWCLPTRKEIDGRLVAGAAIFGIGWGLGGYCPGPGVVAILGGTREALTFVVSMLVGMTVFAAVNRPRPQPHPCDHD